MPKRFALIKDSRKLVEALYGKGVEKVPAWDELEKHLDLPKIEAALTAVLEKHEQEKAKAEKKFLDECTSTVQQALGDLEGTTVTVTSWVDEGGLMHEGWAEYFHGSRWDIRKEIDCDWSFLVELTAVKGEDEYYLGIIMNVTQDLDVGDVKVYLEQNNISFDVSGDLNSVVEWANTKNALAVLCKEQLRQPMLGLFLEELDKFKP